MSLLNSATAPATTKLTSSDDTKFGVSQKESADASTNLHNLDNAVKPTTVVGDENSTAAVETESNYRALLDSKPENSQSLVSSTDENSVRKDLENVDRSNSLKSHRTGPSDHGEYLPNASKHLTLNPVPAFDIQDYLHFASQLNPDQVKGLPFSVRRKLKAMMSGTASESDVLSVAQNLDPILYFSGWAGIKQQEQSIPGYENIVGDSEKDSSNDNRLMLKQPDSNSSNSLTPIAKDLGINANASLPSRDLCMTPVGQDSDTNTIRTPTKNTYKSLSSSKAFAGKKNERGSSPLQDSIPFPRTYSQSRPQVQSSNLSNAIASNSFSSQRTSSPLVTSHTPKPALDSLEDNNSSFSLPLNDASNSSSQQSLQQPFSFGADHILISPKNFSSHNFRSAKLQDDYYNKRPITEGESFQLGGYPKSPTNLPPIRTDLQNLNVLARSPSITNQSANLRRARSNVNRSASASSSYSSSNALSGASGVPMGFRGPTSSFRFDSNSPLTRHKYPSRRNSMFTTSPNNDTSTGMSGSNNMFSPSFSSLSGATPASPALQFLAKIGSATSSPIASRRSSIGGSNLYTSVSNASNVSVASSRFTEGISASAVQGDEDLGAQIGGYIIGTQLGHGGFSVVREARTIDQETGKQVVRAVKIMEAKASAVDMPKEKLEELEKEIEQEVMQYKQNLNEESNSLDTQAAARSFGDGNMATKAIAIAPVTSNPTNPELSSTRYSSDLPMSPLSPSSFSRYPLGSPRPTSANSAGPGDPKPIDNKTMAEKIKEFKLRLQCTKIQDFIHEQSEHLQAEIDHEVILWKELDHPNILKLREVVTKSSSNGILNRSESSEDLAEANEADNNARDVRNYMETDETDLKWNIGSLAPHQKQNLQSPLLRNQQRSGLAEAPGNIMSPSSNTRLRRSSSLMKANISSSSVTDISSLNVGFRTYCFSDKISGGTLYDLIKSQHKVGLNFALVFGYAKQLANAILYLHEIKHIVHRDIKLENCLIEQETDDTTNNGEFVKPWEKFEADRLVLCDFGMSEYFNESSEKEDKEGDFVDIQGKDSRNKFDDEGDYEMIDSLDDRNKISKKIVGPACTSSIMNQYHNHHEHSHSQRQHTKEHQETQSVHSSITNSTSNSTSNSRSNSNTNIANPSSRPMSRSTSLVKATYSSSGTISSTSTTVDHFGSIPYASPEILLSRIPIYKASVDVWSFGVVLYALIMGELPWSHPLGPVLRELIVEANWDKVKLKKMVESRLKEMSSKQSDFNISPDRVVNLLERIFEKDVGKRITIREIVDGRYFG